MNKDTFDDELKALFYHEKNNLYNMLNNIRVLVKNIETNINCDDWSKKLGAMQFLTELWLTIDKFILEKKQIFIQTNLH